MINKLIENIKKTNAPGGMNPSPTTSERLAACVCRGRRPRRPAEGSRPLPTMQKITGRQWQGCGPGMPGPYGLL